MGPVVLHYGASCLGPRFDQSELSWGELSLTRVAHNLCVCVCGGGGGGGVAAGFRTAGPLPELCRLKSQCCPLFCK